MCSNSTKRRSFSISIFHVLEHCSNKNISLVQNSNYLLTDYSLILYQNIQVKIQYPVTHENKRTP